MKKNEKKYLYFADFTVCWVTKQLQRESENDP